MIVQQPKTPQSKTITLVKTDCLTVTLSGGFITFQKTYMGETYTEVLFWKHRDVQWMLQRAGYTGNLQNLGKVA